MELGSVTNAFTIKVRLFDVARPPVLYPTIEEEFVSTIGGATKESYYSNKSGHL